MKLRTASARRGALALGTAVLALGAAVPAALAVPTAPSSSGTTAVSASVNSKIQITAPSDFDFGALDIGGTASATGKQVTVVSNIHGGYQLSVSRTAFSGGDIPLAINASAAPSGALLDLLSGDNAITTSSALNLGHRSSTISPSTGDTWTFGFTLGPVPFVQDGAHSSTLTFTALGL
jgi:hypothetical protein